MIQDVSGWLEIKWPKLKKTKLECLCNFVGAVSVYIFGVSNVSISKVMRHFSNCFLFKFFNFSFICPKKYIQYTRNKYCNMKKWLLKLYLTKKSVFMENSNCFFGSERLIWNPKNIHCLASIRTYIGLKFVRNLFCCIWKFSKIWLTLFPILSIKLQL